MRMIVFAVLAVSAGVLGAQTPSPAPSDPGKLFQLPRSLSARPPQFKLQITPSLMSPIITVHPPATVLDSHIDPGIIRNPLEGSYAVRQGRPAMRQDLFPGLTIQPTEMAGVTPLPTLWPDAKMIPIPTTFPNARFEPIPRNIEGFTAAPVGATVAGSPSRK